LRIDEKSTKRKNPAPRVRRRVSSCHPYPAKMASFGHASAQAPQSVQASASITYLSAPSLMASLGHSLSQAPQLTQSSVMV